MVIVFPEKKLISYIEWVRRPQIGALGMVYVRCNDDGTFKSSVDKFYDQKDLNNWANLTNAKNGDHNFYSYQEIKIPLELK